MVLKRSIIVSIIIVLSALFAGIFALLCFFIFAPQYIESKVIHSIVKEYNIKVSSFKIRNIGLSGAEISDIKIGPDDEKNFEIDSIRVDYSISGLLDREVDNVVLSGISIGLQYTDNRILIEGLDDIVSETNISTKKDNDTSEPFTVKSLSVKNSILHLQVNNKNLMIPFDFTSGAFNQNKLPDRFFLEAYPNSYKISAEGKIGEKKDIHFNLASHDLSLNIFEDILNGIVPLDIKGLANIEISAKLLQEPISITDLQASCTLKDTMIDYPGVTLKNSVIHGDEGQPIILKAESKDLNHWKYNASQILMENRSVPIMLKFSGTADLSGDIQKAEIQAITRIITGDEPPEIKWDIAADRRISSGVINIAINGKPDIIDGKTIPIKTRLDDMLATLMSPELNVKAEYSSGSFSGSYVLNINKIESAYNDMSFSMPDISIKGMLSYDKKNTFNTDTDILIKKGNLSISGNKIKINKISANMPFSWPPPENSPKGKLSISKITYDNYSLGPVNIDVLQKGSSIPFSGSVKFPALPDMSIKISGDTVIDPLLDETKLNIETSYNPTSGIDLAKILPALKGFDYSGKLNSNADIKLSGSGLESTLDLKIMNSTLKDHENDLSLNNISLDLKIEDLVSVRSAFGQRLKVAEISYGDIKAENFTLDFKVDGPSSLFVEKGSFKWCGGNVNIQSFQINPEKKEYDLILFCDRLKLSEILAQFGVANASGGGTVNGRLPINIANNKVTFNDGFLYSTPGGGGKISITETDILTAGLDPNSAEFAQMDIARAALKAFEYAWVKMSFMTEKDELVLKLQFDGKPEGRLPFRYSKDLGKFIRIENSADGSDFEGISLDVNFRVPLDRILNIKDVLDMME